MAQSADHIPINTRYIDVLDSLGSGRMIQGIRRSAMIANAAGPAHNICGIAITETVGAGLTYSMSVEAHQPMMIVDIIDRCTVAAGAGLQTVELKVNGETILPRGFTSDYETTITGADLGCLESVDWIWLVKAGDKIQISGTAANADVMKYIIVAIDLNYDS